MNDIIEILSTDLIEKHSHVIKDQITLAHFIGISMGWHYPLDWSWITSQIGSFDGKRILDAGAGRGLLQWYAAELGAEVYSVDRDSRACLPVHIRMRYNVEGLRSKDLISLSQMINPISNKPPLKEKAYGIARSVLGLTRYKGRGRAPGKIYIYNQDLINLVDISSNSMDYIISVSALEHNQPDDLPKVVDELERVLKPGGAMFITLAAARDEDWYHEPSSGWCYTAETIKKAFRLSDSTPSNYHQYDALFSAINESRALRDQLSRAYFRSNRLGMPNGIWAPQYIPVGVIKTKGD